MRELIGKVVLLVTCRRGNHKRGPLMYLGEGVCDTQHVCNRCGAVENGSVTHKYGWQYLSDSLCEQREVCSRCHTESGEVRTIHQWMEWEYRSDDSCIQHRVCSRCRVKSDDTQTIHKWGEWKYTGECKAQRVCRKCQVSEEQNSHIFTVYKGAVVQGNQVTYFWECSRCGESYIDEEGYVTW